MKKISYFLASAMLVLTSMSVRAQEIFWLGADISGTTEMEAKGIRFYNSKGEIRENTALMKELGLNAVRLRVWVNPRGGWSGAGDGTARTLLRHGRDD